VSGSMWTACAAKSLSLLGSRCVYSGEIEATDVPLDDKGAGESAGEALCALGP
jgi:hypothetical protein